MSTHGAVPDTAAKSAKPEVIAVAASLSAIALFVVSLRLYTRVVLLRNFGIDDGCVVIAFVFTITCCALVALGTRHGLGAHRSTVSDDEFKAFLKMLYLIIVFYNLALAAIKTTFHLQYYRAMPVHKYRKAYIIALIIVSAWSSTQILTSIFFCHPIPAYWDSAVRGKCIPIYPSWYISAAGNIVTDIAILLLPLPILGKLQLGRRQKWILISIFCLGIFTCVISVLRIKFLNVQKDPTWLNAEASDWTLAELCSGIICVCLPTLRPLVLHHFPSLSSNNRSYGRTEDSGGVITDNRTHGSRGLEMKPFPRQTIHSSESQDQLHVYESAVVVRTNISQHADQSGTAGDGILHLDRAL